jgi:hypothetical protein
VSETAATKVSWWRWRLYELRHRAWRLKERLVWGFVWMLPPRVAYLAVIRVWANASTGPWGNESPDSVSVVVALDRWTESKQVKP